MYAAQILARDHVETLAFFPTDDLKVAEMNRVARCYSEKELRVTFNGVVSQMGQAWDGCTQPDPVIWQKEPEPVPSGPVPPLVARIARGIGKEMP
jgi:hypothetical protein